MQQFVYAAGAAITLALSAGAATAQTPSPSPPAAAQTNFSEAQLQAFAAASKDIDPISRTLPSASAATMTPARPLQPAFAKVQPQA